MSKEIMKILMVEDNPGDIVLLRETLREMTEAAYDLINVATLKDARIELGKNSFDVILLDLNLPDGQGLGNISELNDTGMTAPIIIMTGLNDEMLAIEAVRKGAQDYLVKGNIDADVFWRSVRYAVERKRIDEKLKQARDTAEAGTRAKSEFLAHMSHEIRTPLNVIIGIADLLDGTKLDDVQKKYVESFKTSSSTLLSLINDLLDISKVEAGKMEIESISFNFRDLIESIVKFMAIAAEKKENTLAFSIQKGIPDNIMGDPQRLRQIIYNLLGNAIKFTSEGEIHLDVIIDNQGDIRISVSDTGIGIELEKLESVFQDFTQVDGSTSRKYGGTGLGLSICNKLVKLWSGKIWAESDFGKGSKFIFTMPLVKSPDQPESAAREDRQILYDLSPALSEYSPSGPLKILLVDDNPDNLMLLKAYLGDNRISIDEADNGKVALEKVQSQTFAMVFLDMQMPVMDGYTCVKKIRKWEKSNKRKPIPVIALTAYSQWEDKEKCLKAGCSNYISKPVVKGKLFFMISQLLNPAGTRPLPVKKEVQIKIDSSLKEIVPEYLERKKTDVQKIFQAIEKSDFNSIEVVGHNMLGTGTPYGFHDISKLGKIIEIAAIQKDVNTIQSKVEELASYLNDLKVTYN